MIGTLLALYFMISGGTVPGGIERTAVCAIAVSLRDRLIGARARLQVDLDDRVAGDGLALDVVDVADDRREEALEVVGDALLHVLRRQAAVVPDHGDDGDVDVREDVGRRLLDREHAAERDQDRHHDERVGPS